MTTPRHLAHDANYHRSRSAQRPEPAAPGRVVTPEVPEAQDAPQRPTILPRPDLSLPEPELRPPPFLDPLAAMKDVYQRSRGRMSRKTKTLLESPEFEDLLAMLRRIFEDEKLERHPEARLKPALQTKLKGDPGPLLLGLGDPRLFEPWRLFLDGWDIWASGDDGVELFWEGEAEDENGEVTEFLQSIAYAKTELTLSTQLGALTDRITFDGETFYRLRHER